MKAFNLVNPQWGISEIDIIIDTPVNYQNALKNIKQIILQGVSIPTISPEDLILMKTAAARKQDKEDIRSLKKILRQ